MKRTITAVLTAALAAVIIAAVPALAAPKNLVTQANVKNVDEVCAFIDIIAQSADAGSFADNGWQRMTKDSEGNVRVVRASAMDQWSDVMELCTAVGYEYGTADYYYDTPESERLLGTAISHEGPILIRAEIDGKEYKYYFLENQLIRRTAPEGTSDNPKVNAFLNSLWGFGVSYKEPGLVVSEETVDFTVLTAGDIRFENNTFYIPGNVGYAWAEDPDSRTLILDSRTELVNPGNGYFDYYEAGDTAVTWYYKKFLKPDEAAACGVYKVDITGDHIDRVYGSFWWD